MDKKILQKILSMVHDVSSNIDLLGQFRMIQSDVHSHMMIEVSVVESFM